MELNAHETCDYLQNRLNMPLIFEGRLMDIRPGRSVCPAALAVQQVTSAVR
jgi:hypothetical protein